MSRKVLINFGSLKRGGGYNVALNFLSAFDSARFRHLEFFWVCVEGTEIEKVLASRNEAMCLVSENPLIRIIQESTVVSKWIRKNQIEVIYTYFGYGCFTMRVPQVVGTAVSNVFFPEVNFWEHYHGLARLRKNFIDSYRLWGLRRASGIIFENSAMEARAVDVVRSNVRTITVLPSIDISANAGEEWKSKVASGINSGFVGLFLCGWQLNKGVMLIPDILADARDRGFDLKIILTAPEDQGRLHKSFVRRISNLNVTDRVFMVGPVRKRQLASLYNKVDLVFLLSKLESFSNNIIEAWTYSKPLVVADEPWAHSLCSNAALYVDRENVTAIVDSVMRLVQADFRERIVESGLEQLGKFPSPSEKVEAELDFVYKIK
jgi:glycosyltransferase involved in cell wall biosynthesis